MWAEREPVANDEHLAVLRQGVEVWNEWRIQNSSIAPDLREADLKGMELRGADFSKANLNDTNFSNADLRRVNFDYASFSGANLRRANLRKASLDGVTFYAANLSEANLSKTDLHSARFLQADLSWANLRGADLQWAEIYDTKLNGADLNGAELVGTTLKLLELDETTGLEQCKHLGPSFIDLDTLLACRNIPISFLRGCGVPERVIEYLPSLRGDAIQFYSCFISYSSRDQTFAERLHADLQDKGVRCWFAPHDLPIGAKTWDAIDDAIRLRDKLLVILSEASIASDWVEDEVNKAYAEERSRKEVVLFPIRLDNSVMSTAEPWAVKLRDQRNIGDFRRWKKPAEYQKSLERLLRDLKAPVNS
jgi:TIR domain/Pentapeptide repeats (8 copies)